jgi:hypothetical protein
MKFKFKTKGELISYYTFKKLEKLFTSLIGTVTFLENRNNSRWFP